MSENGNIIEARDLTKVYEMPAERIVAVDAVDLTVKSGEFVALMGPSGSGKTTLLDLVGCLDSLTSGELKVFGEDVSGAGEKELVRLRRCRIGFVFQDFLLLPELTALENVMLPAAFARTPINEGSALALLDKVGLAHRGRHLPKELSGGERQRVAIARSLAASPKLLLADEPTGNLDTENSRDIFNTLLRLNRDDGLTVVLTTHDRDLGALAGRQVLLRDGRIEG